VQHQGGRRLCTEEAVLTGSLLGAGHLGWCGDEDVLLKVWLRLMSGAGVVDERWRAAGGRGI
jgi:hypothetical protein